MSSKRRKRREAERQAQANNLRGGLGDSPASMLKDGQMGQTKSFADRILSRGLALHGRNEGPVPTLPAPPPQPAKLPPAGKIEMPAPKLPPAPPLTPPAVVQPSKAEVDLVQQNHDQKALIWKMAQDNQDYYLLMQMEDNKSPGGPKPWFMFPRYPYQYSEFVMVTPDMARIMLAFLWSKEEGNRNKKPGLVDSYKRDIMNDCWVPSDEAIGINLSFEVYNGQHRLWAIIESGKPMPMYVTWNVLDAAKFFVESGAKRTLAERLKMVVEPKLGNRTSGFCKAIMRGLTPRVKYTDAEIAAFADKWDHLLEWVAEHLPIGRAEVQAAIGKAYLWYGPEKVEPFCYRLREIKFPDDGDPAKALFRALDAAKKNRINVALMAYKKTLQAMHALHDEREINKLHESNEDIFQWEPGWELPKTAPTLQKK
jgi:hypothetical protein